ncbi:hypothetical protein CTRI78_v002742 [Colletotrichum trifolii]|uniref:Avirulence Effector AvrLm4-7 domain-containing protein n=1 Tax=Colletotrichum trifolii TaxID=5466 RepID=A0A4R8RLB0_COLTR|nr:hypothetical protein CTRI78_v002742 [Colletotrichum trifolii]
MAKNNLFYALPLLATLLQQASCCRQAIVTYSKQYDCGLNNFVTAVDDDCKKLADSIGTQGRKFAEIPTVDSIECLECDNDGEFRRCRCMLTAWRFRDWEPEPAKYQEFQYEYWRPMENGKLDVSCDS